MRAPSVKKLLLTFRDLTDSDAKLIRALAHGADDPDELKQLIDDHVPGTAKYVRAMYSDPYRSHMWRVTVALHAMNEVLGTYGVEALGPDIGGPSPPPYEYLNTGDTYGTTLIYRRRDDSLHIGNWGDIVERYGEHWQGRQRRR